jgi:hypothetical protein
MERGGDSGALSDTRDLLLSSLRCFYERRYSRSQVRSRTGTRTHARTRFNGGLSELAVAVLYSEIFALARFPCSSRPLDCVALRIIAGLGHRLHLRLSVIMIHNPRFRLCLFGSSLRAHSDKSAATSIAGLRILSSPLQRSHRANNFLRIRIIVTREDLICLTYDPTPSPSQCHSRILKIRFLLTALTDSPSYSLLERFEVSKLKDIFLHTSLHSLPVTSYLELHDFFF